MEMVFPNNKNITPGLYRYVLYDDSDKAIRSYYCHNIMNYRQQKSFTHHEKCYRCGNFSHIASEKFINMYLSGLKIIHIKSYLLKRWNVGILHE